MTPMQYEPAGYEPSEHNADTRAFLAGLAILVVCLIAMIAAQ